MKRALVVLAVLAAFAAPALAHGANDMTVLKFSASGTAVPLGDPFAGGFSMLMTFQGRGPHGTFSAQSLVAFQKIDLTTGELVCGAGQIGIRFESTGDMLLLNISPGLVGTLAPVSPTAFRSQQRYVGTVVDGTGRFAGATGTFTLSISGFAAQPGFVHIAEGTLKIALDRE